MSLQIWLPLTKDLHNQGLANVSITNNGAIYSSTGGKLGGTYSFDGTDDYIQLTGNILYSIIKGDTTPFSMAMWVYHADASRAILFGDYSLSGAINFNIELTTSHTLRFYWAGTPDYAATQTSVGASTWTHIAIVYDGSKVLFYTNGILTNTYTGTLSGKTKSSGSYYLGRDSRTGTTALSGKLNDFRLYDNVLSEKEIKEISKGLILYYPLNRRGLGQENLILNSNVEKSGKNTIITYDLSSNGITAVMGQTMRISADIKSDTANSVIDCYVRSSTSNSMCSNTIFNNIGTTYKRYTMTTICNQNQDKTPQWFAFRCNGSNGTTTTATFTIKNVKLELGEKTTPYSLNSTDTIYSQMNLGSTIEYDYSGFNNNGTKTGTFVYTSDTPKYEVSTQFTGTQYITGISPSSEGATIALWVKTTSTGNAAIMIDYKSKLGFGFWSGVIIPSCNSAIKTTYSVTNYIINQWNHIAVVRTGDSSLQLYINGVLQTTPSSAQDYWSGGVIDGLSIAARPNGSSPVSCQVSDARIYATALSATDVLSLYNNNAYIDQSGQIYGPVREV